MSGSKTVRESRKLLEPMGYELVGWNQNSHLVYRHAATGAITRVVNGFDASPRGQKNMLLQARQAIRTVDSISKQVVELARSVFGVGPYDEREVELSMIDLERLFRAKHPDLQLSSSLVGIAMKDSPHVDLVKRGHGGKGLAKRPGVYRIRGELFGVNPVEEAADVVVPEPVVEPAPVPVGDPAAVPAGDAAGGTEPVSEADGTEPVDDPVAPESARPVVVDGLTLPSALVKQLRSVIGVDGDLQAENDLLRENLTTVLRGLEMVTEAVQTALSLHAPDKRARDRGHLGSKRARQYHAMRDAGLEGPISKYEIMPLLGVGDAEANNILYTLGQAGLMRRVGRGTYEWEQVAG